MGQMEAEPRRDAAGDGRNETPVERYDRNWNDILQELRTTQTGTQILTGFLLAVAFQPAFGDLEPYERSLYLTLVALASLATIIGIAPVIMHRRLFRQHKKEALVRAANRLLIAMLVVVSLLVAGVAGLIFDVAVSRTAGWIAMGAVLVIVALVWATVPRIGRNAAPDDASR